jgi:hypothetical protein
MKKAVLMLLVVSICLAFTRFGLPDKPVPIPVSKQRTGGDAQKGYEYLTTGDYVKSGVPYQFFMMGNGNQKLYLQRTGINKNIPHSFTAIKAFNGETVVAPNCLQCHAQVVDGKLFIGLGNSFSNFAQGPSPRMLGMAETLVKNTNPAQYEASATFFKVSKAIAEYIKAPIRGVNTADRLAGVLAAHRDPITFQWSNDPLLPIPDEIVATDVPAWWLLRKKNAMFYNGFGRGDFGRFLMASNLLTVTDTIESAEVDSHMPDVLAYIYSLRAPAYPYTLNKALASKGKVLFEANCSKCHGTYGEVETYPNLLIPASIIKTDSLLFKSNYSSPQFVNWFNKSWFTSGDHPARLEPFNGYIAPPLDGIWITAPYLHNASVPTLEAMLNSKARPKYWSRSFENPEIDTVNGGWKYKVHTAAGRPEIYNTTVPGYGNYGHYFGDKLSAAERKAIIEYLKTL